MNSMQGLSDQNWSFNEIERIDSICDEFERMWNDGLSPAIEAFLDDKKDLPRSHLLFELIRLECDLLRRAGTFLTQEDYLLRFPQDQETIAQIWQECPSLSTRGMPPTIRMEDSPVSQAHAKDQCDQLGRYKILRTLGKGGFGIVYLAYDPVRGHDIALKIPHPHVLQSPHRREELMRDYVGQKLDHPHLVKTLGIEEDSGQMFIAMQFIDGSNLSEWCHDHRPTPHQVVEIVIQVSEALGYLHEQGYTHRDLKPANILIGKDRTAYVADFGLTLHEDEQRQYKGQIALTWPYMSPEQIRREAHLVDGQSDIWSVGVMMYRLFTDRLPFGGPPPRRNSSDYSAYIGELEKEIPDHDPKPPRMIRPELSRKLEEICLRCLEKRKRDRYQTAHDLAEELRLYIDKSGEGLRSTNLSKAASIVPKGLRSFDATDAEFFLELLPGPRTSAGLPSSLNFWRNRLSGTRGINAIDVGVIYGPSGCGKSSLVKAGLLPLLGNDFVPVVIEANAADTEVRLLKALRQVVPRLALNDSLVEVCRQTGERGAGGDRKILLVFDQFEQWLHSHADPSHSQLLAGLKYCNGLRMQALFLVRDDFWMPLTRFMEQLEIPLHEDNSLAVDLFNRTHAHSVLCAFGRAYGRLPADGQLTAAQEVFLEQAIDGLAEEGRIICVRLALFADMMKDRPWTREELTAVGGAKGIGVAFLEEKFGRTGRAIYQPHCTAAKKVLDCLLPPFGSDLKGQMRTVDELREAAGYSTPRAFEQLIQILSSDLKLLTPTASDNPDGSPTLDGGEPPAFQLTHDYLVPSIRQWLTADLIQTRAGRALIRLRERADDWNRKPESRRLPSLLETVEIGLRTKAAAWTAPQASMMRSAQRWHGCRLAVFALMLMFASAIGTFFYREYLGKLRQGKADAAVDQLMVADIGRVIPVLIEMEDTRDLWKDQLRSIADSKEGAQSDKLRAELALVSHDRQRLTRLLQLIGDADVETMRVVRDWLAAKARPDVEELWKLANESQKPAKELRIAALLAEFDPQADAPWRAIAESTIKTLVTDVSVDAVGWAELLMPVREQLGPALSNWFVDRRLSSSQRLMVAQLLGKLASTELLCRLVPDADGASMSHFLRPLARDSDSAVAFLHPTLNESRAEGDVEDRLLHVARQRAVAVALLLLERGDLVWPLLSASKDGSLRTELILTMRNQGVSLGALLRAEEIVRDPVARQAIWESMIAGEVEITPQEKADILQRLQKRLPLVKTFAEMSGILCVAQRCGFSNELKSGPLKNQPEGADWSVNSQGQTFVNVTGPIEFHMGSPSNEPRRDGNEMQHVRRIDRSILMSAYEVTAEQFRRYQPTYSPDPNICVTTDCPASYVSWLDAVKYCRWLSEQEKVPEDQMCYPPVDQIHLNMDLPADQLSRTGYRLPTEAEWEYCCRGGTETRYFFGEDEKHLSEFGWWLANSSERTWPVGTRSPNMFGLFDFEGNVHEWCQDAFAEYPQPSGSQTVAMDDVQTLKGAVRVCRGANYRSAGRTFRTAFRFQFSGETGFSATGFRVVRTSKQNSSL